ncbi:oligosaccharide flippase family protein [Flavobacterium sp. XS1P32]|uniref:oligosaccharide flippase family protein n=1 Tax=Flavobacterium sp. XS1P32 TaxID=3401726 RepID=UPI003AB0CBC9
MFKSNQLFFKNFSIYFLGLFLSGLISFMTIPLIVKIYGVEKYGDFSLVQNVILILISFGGGWLNQCVLRFNNFSYKFKIGIFQLSFIILIPLSLICFGIIKLIGNNFWISLIGVLTLIFGSISVLLITFYQSKSNAKKSIFFDFIRIFSFVFCIYGLSYLFKEVDSLSLLIGSFFLSYLISFLFLLRIDYRFIVVSIKIFLKQLNLKKISNLINENNHLISYGWPIALWFTISAILNISDRYIISYYLTDNDLGTYSAIYDLLYKGVTLVYSPVLVAGYPIMAQKFNQGFKKDAFRFLKKLILFEILIFAFIIVVSYFYKSFFIDQIVCIPLTSSSVGLVLPIVTGAFIWQLAMLVHKPLEFELKTVTMLLFISIALLFNVGLNFLFIPHFGILFAAYSTLFSATVYLGLSAFKIRSLNQV